LNKSCWPCKLKFGLEKKLSTEQNNGGWHPSKDCKASIICTSTYILNHIRGTVMVAQMKSEVEFSQLPGQVQERLTDLVRQVRLPPVDLQVRQWHLTDAERLRAEQENLGPTIIEVYSVIKGISPYHAVIEIARKRNFSYPAEAEELLRHLGVA